jgi:AtzE family amidohydrolase
MKTEVVAIADAVRQGQRSAVAIVEKVLAGIEELDGSYNCFTTVTVQRALDDARRVDRQVADGLDPGPLAGVPFAVKNLFDIRGTVTLAGSIINAERPPASSDADAVAALAGAGAVLVGALNMDEYAYGFTTENTHYGPCRNPRDPNRMAGGSSGGSAAAVAAGFVPLTLGSDTNGSVRVPAALCGVFGLKPTYGRLSRAGMALFAPSLDTVGVLATSARDLTATFEVVSGCRLADQAGSQLRIAIADGHFSTGGVPEVFEAVEAAAVALGVEWRITIPEAARARAAAYLITASEGADQHLRDLQTRPEQFDPMTRDRFLSGALLPTGAYLSAQRFRRWYRDQVQQLFAQVDIILAPTTPFPAPLIGEREAVVGQTTVRTQPYLGVFTQPLSFIGLPVVSVPVLGRGGLPLGVQVVAAPSGEAKALHVAGLLEEMGLTMEPPPADRWR